MAPESGVRGAVRRIAQQRLVLPVLLLAGAASWAQSPAKPLYTCVANGRTYSGDVPPLECAHTEVRELNRDGSLRRVISRPLTAEEQRTRAAEAKKRLEDEETALAQRRRDRALLESYANEVEIEAARARALESSGEAIRRAETRLQRMDADLKRLQDEAEFYRKGGVPENLKYAIGSVQKDRAAEAKVLLEAQEEMHRVNARFDDDRKRFRELLARGARPVQRAAQPDLRVRSGQAAQ